MANNLFNQLNPNGMPQQQPQSNPMPNFLANLTGMQSDFDAFKKEVTGDPEATVKNLLASGQMSQQQFQQLSMFANMLRGRLK